MQMAGRASVELHTLIFFRGKEVVADARITKVRLSPILPEQCLQLKSVERCKSVSRFGRRYLSASDTVCLGFLAYEERACACLGVIGSVRSR